MSEKEVRSQLRLILEAITRLTEIVTKLAENDEIIFEILNRKD